MSISNFVFGPTSVSVAAGSTVVWTNRDPMGHTVTGAGFDSGELNPGATYRHTFDTAGTYTYHCTIHPFMTGTVIVTP